MPDIGTRWAGRRCCGKNDAEVAERAAQPVRVTRVAFAPLTAVESYTGTIRPQHEAPLGFRQPGKLIPRLVDVGDMVTAGQVVARLDDTDARLELQVAEAELAAATTDLARATADLSRSLSLFAEGHVAQAALDRATSAAAEAHSRADRAVQARSLAANRLSYMDLAGRSGWHRHRDPGRGGSGGCRGPAGGRRCHVGCGGCGLCPAGAEA